VRGLFDLQRHGTSVRREAMAALATFLTMAYIVVVNPAILEAAGIPRGPSTTATILAAAFGTLVMGLYARRPFAIAPYMGENAFIAVTVVQGMGWPWPKALGAIFVAGVAFTLLTAFRVRGWLATAIPPSLKHSFSVAIGLFLTFLGLTAAGIVVAGGPGHPVALGALDQPGPLLAVFAFMLTVLLLVKRVPGALLAGILATTALAWIVGASALPQAVIAPPPSLAPVFAKLDVVGALSPAALPVVLVVFVMAFVDTIGTLIGLSARAGLLDEQGNLPDIERPMMADALANLAAPVLGTTTSGAYIESAAGIEEGGRTGLTAVFVAILFLGSLFFAPLAGAVPAFAYGATLVVIGILMVAPVTRIDFSDLTELVPAFLTIVLTAFTYNLGVGMTAGLVVHPVLKLAAGRAREVPLGLWLLAMLALAFYLVYPYRS
jgi:AGZA family xanthine/uracil permease-like MFS transporter